MIFKNIRCSTAAVTDFMNNPIAQELKKKMNILAASLTNDYTSTYDQATATLINLKNQPETILK